MPRRGSGSFGGSRSRPSPTRNTTAQAPPMRQAPSPSPPAQTQSRPSMFSGFGSTMVQGMAFGAGSEVAHHAIRGVIGGGSGNQSQPAEQGQQAQQQQTQQSQVHCENETTFFSNCLRQQNDINMCQSYMDMLKECQKRYNV